MKMKKVFHEGKLIWFADDCVYIVRLSRAQARQTYWTMKNPPRIPWVEDDKPAKPGARCQSRPPE